MIDERDLDSRRFRLQGGGYATVRLARMEPYPDDHFKGYIGVDVQSRGGKLLAHQLYFLPTLAGLADFGPGAEVDGSLSFSGEGGWRTLWRERRYTLGPKVLAEILAWTRARGELKPAEEKLVAGPRGRPSALAT